MENDEKQDKKSKFIEAIILYLTIETSRFYTKLICREIHI